MLYQDTFKRIKVLMKILKNLYQNQVINQQIIVRQVQKEFYNFRNRSQKITMFFNKKILVKGYSSLVKEILISTHQKGLKLKIYILENRPECEGYLMYKELKEAGLTCFLLVDSAMGYIMEQIDYVLTGAEVVTENGGIINRIGTYSLALCACPLEKPIYVLAETYKFSRIFPLDQNDIKNEVQDYKNFKLCNTEIEQISRQKNIQYVAPQCDFTPSSYISFIISDSRIFKPQCISDEMLQLFNF